MVGKHRRVAMGQYYGSTQEELDQIEARIDKKSSWVDYWREEMQAERVERLTFNTTLDAKVKRLVGKTVKEKLISLI